MAPNPRVAKAFRAMRDIGIPEEKTKPVLKRLIKIYDKNWELIEEENYRALADAIFDSEETEAAEQKKKLDNDQEAESRTTLEQAERMKAIEEETHIQEEPERPLKRLRSRQQDNQASPSSNNPSNNSNGILLKKPKLEIDELPSVTEPVTSIDSPPVSPLKRSRNKGKQPISPNDIALLEGSDASQSGHVESTQPIANAIDSESAILSRRLRDKGKAPLSPQSAPLRQMSISDKPSPAVCIREPKVKPGIDVVPKQKTPALIKPKEEPLTDDPPRSEVPIAVHLPESLTNGDETENNLVKGPNGSVESMVLGNSVQATSNENIPDESTAKLDIASSSSGEIKIYFSCNSAQGNPKFSLMSVDTVLKTMEDKCLKSYKVLDPNFSVKKLMKDMCECLLDLGSDPLKESNGNDCEKQIEQNGFENHTTPDDTRSSDDVNDIAKGQESVIISLVNEVNSKCPPSFHYIPQNAVFQNAYVDFSLARIEDDNCCSTCFGNCLTSSTPCPCALQCGGEFAYTTDGLVKEELLDQCIEMIHDPQKHCLSYCKICPLERSKNETILKPCKGHSSKSFIKECWLKCGCNKKCGNRVVQCGIKYNLQVFMTSEGKGWGLRTLEDLPKGAFVCEYVGEVLTCGEVNNRVSQSSNKDEYSHSVLLDADWSEESELKDEEALCLDATYYGNVARFINHRCFDSNLIEIPVEVENPDRHYYHLAFFTTRKMKALEELTWDYGIDFDDDDDNPVKGFECLCDSRFCRNVKRSSRSRKRM